MNAYTTDDSDDDSVMADQRNRTWSDFSDIMEDEVAERLNKNRILNGMLIMAISIGFIYTYYYIMASV